MKPATQLRLYALLLGLVLLTMAVIYDRYLRERPTATPPDTERDLGEISAEGRLRILAGYRDFAEHRTAPEGDNIYEQSKRISAHTGLEVQIVLEDSDAEALDMLSRGDVDVIARPLIRTSSIDTLRFAWVNEDTSGPIYLVQRSDTTLIVHQQLDLAGSTITLATNSPLELFVRHLSEEIGDSIHIQYDPHYQSEQLVALVAHGAIDYTLCTSREAETFRRRYPQLDITLPVSYSLRRGWLVRRSAPILRDSLELWSRL